MREERYGYEKVRREEKHKAKRKKRKEKEERLQMQIEMRCFPETAFLKNQDRQRVEDGGP